WGEEETRAAALEPGADGAVIAAAEPAAGAAGAVEAGIGHSGAGGSVGAEIAGRIALGDVAVSTDPDAAASGAGDADDGAGETRARQLATQLQMRMAEFQFGETGEIHLQLAGQQQKYVADLNDDGELDMFDLLEFQRLLEMGDIRADFDGSSALDHMDSVAFQSEMAAGTLEPQAERPVDVALLKAVTVQYHLQLTTEVENQTRIEIAPLIEAARQR